MALVPGTAGADRLVGTGGDDTLTSGGTSDRAQSDVMTGGGGADTCDLYNLTGGRFRNFIIDDDRSTDGAFDRILNAGALYQFDRGAPGAGWGHDTIGDTSNKASYQNEDTIELRGVYGPMTGVPGEAHAKVSFARDG